MCFLRWSSFWNSHSPLYLLTPRRSLSHTDFEFKCYLSTSSTTTFLCLHGLLFPGTYSVTPSNLCSTCILNTTESKSWTQWPLLTPVFPVTSSFSKPTITTQIQNCITHVRTEPLSTYMLRPLVFSLTSSITYTLNTCMSNIGTHPCSGDVLSHILLFSCFDSYLRSLWQKKFLI